MMKRLHKLLIVTAALVAAVPTVALGGIAPSPQHTEQLVHRAQRDACAAKCARDCRFLFGGGGLVSACTGKCAGECRNRAAGRCRRVYQCTPYYRSWQKWGAGPFGQECKWVQQC